MVKKLSKEKIDEQEKALAGTVVEALREMHGEEIVLLDVRGQSVVTDFYLLASAKNVPHLRALASEALTVLKKETPTPVHMNGVKESGWIILDAIDMVVHLFLKEQREFYRLEELWNDAVRVDIE